jgi:hypothetical protein
MEAGHGGRPANTWHVTDLQVGNTSLDPYKYPPVDGIQDTGEVSGLVVVA